jgi:hypothetical protein
MARITAASGGTEVSSGKFDTSTTSLPTQAKLHISPTSITESSVLGYRPDTRRFGETLGGYYAVHNASFLGAPGNIGTDYANLYYRGRDSSVESWTCREGEGIALISDTIGMPMGWSARLSVRNLSTGKSYLYEVEPSLVETPAQTGRAYWAFMNNSGSGVTLEVTVVDANEVGYTNVMPEYALIKVSGCLGPDRRTFAPIARDTNDTCPATVYGVLAPFVAWPTAADLGAAYDIPYSGPQAGSGTSIAQQLRYSRIRHKTYHPIVQVTTSPAHRFGAEGDMFLNYPTSMLGLMLRSGEGVALVQRSSAILNRSCLIPVEASMTFVLTTPTVTAGSTVIMARTYVR